MIWRIIPKYFSNSSLQSYSHKKQRFWLPWLLSDVPQSCYASKSAGWKSNKGQAKDLIRKHNPYGKKDYEPLSKVSQAPANLYSQQAGMHCNMTKLSLGLLTACIGTHWPGSYGAFQEIIPGYLPRLLKGKSQACIGKMSFCQASPSLKQVPHRPGIRTHSRKTFSGAC